MNSSPFGVQWPWSWYRAARSEHLSALTRGTRVVAFWQVVELIKVSIVRYWGKIVPVFTNEWKWDWYPVQYTSNATYVCQAVLWESVALSLHNSMTSTVTLWESTCVSKILPKISQAVKHKLPLSLTAEGVISGLDSKVGHPPSISIGQLTWWAIVDTRSEMAMLALPIMHDWLLLCGSSTRFCQSGKGGNK